MLDHFPERNVVGAIEEVGKFHSQLRLEDYQESMLSALAVAAQSSKDANKGEDQRSSALPHGGQ